jgi:hypothetical protein
MNRISKTEHCNLTRKFVWFFKLKFSSATLSLDDIQVNFSSPKKGQMKAGQNMKYDITKTSGLVQV